MQRALCFCVFFTHPDGSVRNESDFLMDPNILAATLISSGKVLWMCCGTGFLMLKKVAGSMEKYDFPR